MLILVLLSVLTAPLLCAAQSQHQPTFAEQQDAIIARLKQVNGPGTNAALRSELLRMRHNDQAVRAVKNWGKPAQQEIRRMADIDRANTERLKEIVSRYGWPTIKLVGFEASEGAELVLSHSPDLAFQSRMMPVLEEEAKRREIYGTNLANLIDIVLVRENKPQQFGTRFKIEPGRMIQYPVEDSQNLDKRRAELGLPPIAVYKKFLSDFYHLHVE